VGAGLRVLWRAWRHFNQRGYIYIWGNFFAVLCALPVVTAPAAWAGLVKMSYHAHLTPTSDVNDFWEGFRQNLRRSLVMTGLNVLVVGVNLSNLSAYAGQTGALTNGLRLVWLVALLVWFSVQFYMWPLFYHMETPTLVGAMRNALVMLYLNPLFTLVIWVGVLIVIALSLFLPPSWLLLSFSLLVCIATGAVLDRLNVPVYIPEALQEETQVE
jgi:uncharacterized membrane protein YesL